MSLMMPMRPKGGPASMFAPSRVWDPGLMIGARDPCKTVTPTRLPLAPPKVGCPNGITCLPAMA